MKKKLDPEKIHFSRMLVWVATKASFCKKQQLFQFRGFSASMPLCPCILFFVVSTKATCSKLDRRTICDFLILLKPAHFFTYAFVVLNEQLQAMFRRAALVAAPCVIGGQLSGCNFFPAYPELCTRGLRVGHTEFVYIQYIHTAVRSILYVVMHMDVQTEKQIDT